MAAWTDPSPSDVSRDLAAGLVVFLVALPLCLGVALASNAPLLSGLLAGIVGGILVGILSGSQTSVSGPAAGLTAVVAAQIAALGSFQAFLLAVVIAGLIQIALGLARAGFLAAFFPSSVIKGLLAAIGVILILKQIPHVLGHDPDPEGDMAFLQPDHANTFSEFGRLLGDIQPGAAVIGLAVDRAAGRLGAVEAARRGRTSRLPWSWCCWASRSAWLFRRLGGRWAIEPSHLVQVPVADSLAGLLGFLPSPDFSQWANPAVYIAGRDDRRRGLAGDAAEPGGGRQARPAATHLAPEPGTAGPGDRERGRRADRRAADHVGDRPQFGEHQRRGQDEARDDRPRRRCCWSASCSCPPG